nr:AAA family ATPase [Tsuneonella aeria]
MLPLLGTVSLCGEIGVWYAPPNTGKTLIVLHLAIEAVMHKRIAAGSVFYANVDDSLMGVAEKMKVLDDFGIHGLATGQRGFKPSSLIPAMREMVQTGTAHGTLIILDTLKKVLDLMNKKEAREFGLQAREFAMAGGSLIALAHTNKNRGANQKLVHAGTSDIVEDFDSAYLLDVAATGQQPNERVVRFECIKNRGGTALEAFYAYSTVDGLSYAQRLATVKQVDPEYGENADDIRQTSEQAIIEAIRAAISAGRTKKMEIVSLVTMATKASRAVVLALLEARTGPSSEGALWDFERKARGAHVFFLHPETGATDEQPESDASDLASQVSSSPPIELRGPAQTVSSPTAG